MVYKLFWLWLDKPNINRRVDSNYVSVNADMLHRIKVEDGSGYKRLKIIRYVVVFMGEMLKKNK